MDNSPNEKFKIVKDYLQNPWVALPKDKEEKIKSLVHFPLKNPEKSGGLTKKGIKWAHDNNYQELLDLSSLAKEKTRIDIHATLKSAYLFAKGKKESLTDQERETLFEGIVLGSSLERIQTVKKGGKLLAAGFVDKLGVLYKKLKDSNKDGQNQKYLKVLEQAAIEHKKAEIEEKKISEKIAGL
jgi:hypothetical protein